MKAFLRICKIIGISIAAMCLMAGCESIERSITALSSDENPWKPTNEEFAAEEMLLLTVNVDPYVGFWVAEEVNNPTMQGVSFDITKIAEQRYQLVLNQSGVQSKRTMRVFGNCLLPANRGRGETYVHILLCLKPDAERLTYTLEDKPISVLKRVRKES